MSRIIKLGLSVAMVCLMVVSCADQRGSLLMEPAQNSHAFGNWMLPAGATYVSASLNIYVTQPSNETVTIHRVTAAWDEATVTWGNFGGAFDAAVVGSFACDDFGWKSADISGLVGGWLAGDYTNLGLLLDQPEVYFRTATYNSREAVSDRPYIEVCYMMGGSLVCENVADIGDAYIRELYDDLNYGGLDWLGTGWGAPEYLEKQCLLMFNVERSPSMARIGDKVWHDLDMDGIQDAGEPGIPGVIVHLLDCAGTTIGSFSTDVNGNYWFEGLIPGDYKVVFVAPSGWTISPMNVGGDDTVDSDADPTTGMASCTTLDPGESDMTWDAGMFENQEETAECKGKVTELTMRYDGSIVDAHIIVKAKKNIVLFDGIVQPGEMFNFVGHDRHGTMGPETYYYVNGVLNTNIHTSCSQDIGPGLVSGDFTVIEGYSRAGLLPPL